MAIVSNVQDTANPAPSTTAAGVFDRFFSNVVQLGGNYLTLKGQAEVAQAMANTQARLNSYSAVNPSLGAVNPAAAQLEANKTWVQRYLPFGSPTVGAPGSGQAAQAGSNVLGWVIAGGVALLVVLLIIRAVRK